MRSCFRILEVSLQMMDFHWKRGTTLIASWLIFAKYFPRDESG